MAFTTQEDFDAPRGTLEVWATKLIVRRLRTGGNYLSHNRYCIKRFSFITEAAAKELRKELINEVAVPEAFDVEFRFVPDYVLLNEEDKS